MNGKEPLSRYGQLGNGIQVDQTQGQWIDTLVEDKRASVADQVAAKLDVGAWFATLTQTDEADRQRSGVRLLDVGGCGEVRSDAGQDFSAAADVGRVVGSRFSRSPNRQWLSNELCKMLIRRESAAAGAILTVTLISKSELRVA